MPARYHAAIKRRRKCHRKRVRRRGWTAVAVLCVFYVAIMPNHRHAGGLLAVALVVVIGGVLTVKVVCRQQRDRRYMRSGLAEVDAMSGVPT